MPKVQLAISTPEIGKCNWPYTISMMGLNKGGLKAHYLPMKGWDGTAAVYQRIANWFMFDTDADWLFIPEADSFFHPGTLMRLMERDLPIITPLAFKPFTPVTPYVYRQELEGKPGYFLTESHLVAKWLHNHPDLITKERAGMLDDYGEDSLLEVRRISTHVSLIKREALAAIEPPWFVENPDKELVKVGGNQDFMFSAKAEAAGVPMYVDLSVTVGHGESKRGMIGALDFLIWYQSIDWDTGQVRIG